MPHSSTILYLHGFNSSPASHKASVLKDWLARNSPETRLATPALPATPKRAMQFVEQQYFSTTERPRAIVGSSLGGYYALYLSDTYRLPAVIINPAVRPYALLTDYLGANRNPYTGEDYVLRQSHMQELLALERVPDPAVTPVLTLLQTGDQTLDYREALVKLAGHPMWLIPGGSHEFDSFEACLPALCGFLQH